MTTQVDVSGAPRTYIGLWLRALLRGDSQEYRRLVHKLNRGKKGWNDDEPAVVEAACQLAVRHFFNTYRHVAIDRFVTEMRERIAKVRIPPRQEDMEAVIRAALDDDVDVPSDIGRGELNGIRGAITANVVDILELDSDTIDSLIIEAEIIAMERGFSPPLAMQS